METSQNEHSKKEKHKTRCYGKMNFSSTPGNSQKDYVDEITNSMFDENKILQDTTFAKQLLKKMRKRLRQRSKKKKTSSFQTCKNNLENEI